MNKVFLIAIIALFSQISLATEKPLPNWIDHSREQIHPEATGFLKGYVPAPPVGFRLPAEYEAAQAVAIGYKGYYPMLDEIARAVTKSGAEIWISSYYKPISGVDASKVKPFDCSLDTVWMRDYGPFGLTETNELAIADTVYRHYRYRLNDDKAPTCIANSADIPSYDMPIILDGGNLMVDSKGNLFMTKRTYIWNNTLSEQQVNTYLKEYFGVHTIHAFDYPGYPGEPADGTGHIDMFVKLLNDSTVLISTGDTKAFKDATDKAVKYFQSIKTPDGGQYKIIRTPGWYNGAWYTYTNSLLVNNLAMVPLFSGKDAENQMAKNAYLEGRPELDVKMIKSDDSIRAGGSIHCVTQLIPATK